MRMKKFLLLTFLIASPVFAKPTECPIYQNKQDCLKAVASNYEELFDFINENYGPDDNSIEKKELIEASLDIKKYESLACKKTCLN